MNCALYRCSRNPSRCVLRDAVEHRTDHMKSMDHRGTPEFPGLVVTLISDGDLEVSALPPLSACKFSLQFHVNSSYVFLLCVAPSTDRCVTRNRMQLHSLLFGNALCESLIAIASVFQLILQVVCVAALAAKHNYVFVFY